MRTGRQTLGEINDAIGQARSRLDESVALAGRLAEQRAALQRERLEAVSIIAAKRLDLLRSGKARQAGDDDIRRADARAAELLQTQAEDMSRLESAVKAAKADLEQLEGQRPALEDSVDDAVNAFEAAAAASQERLMQDAAYKSLLEKAEEAEALVDRAERKQILAKQDETEKGAPYRDDPLFSYLWKRQFGTKDYRGGSLTKMLDGWVAGLIGYRDAALNFKRLTEIPARLANHVGNLQQRADDERQALSAMENQALEDDGAAALRQASLAEQARLEALDAKIVEAETVYRESLDDLAEGNGSGSPAYQQALRILTDALETEGDQSDLLLLSSQTESLEDDDAVALLIDLEDEADDLEDDEEDAREAAGKYRRSLEDLEQVRQRFKQARYDAPSSEFPTGELIGSMLGQLLAGALTSDVLWDTLRRGQRTSRRRADFDFGGDDWGDSFRLPDFSGRSGRSGGGRMTRPSRVPRQRSGRSSNGSRGRGGGFRTGGGF